MQKHFFGYVERAVKVLFLNERSTLQRERIRIMFVHFGQNGGKDCVSRERFVLIVISLGKVVNGEVRSVVENSLVVFRSLVLPKRGGGDDRVVLR